MPSPSWGQGDGFPTLSLMLPTLSEALQWHSLPLRTKSEHHMWLTPEFPQPLCSLRGLLFPTPSFHTSSSPLLSAHPWEAPAPPHAPSASILPTQCLPPASTLPTWCPPASTLPTQCPVPASPQSFATELSRCSSSLTVTSWFLGVRTLEQGCVCFPFSHSAYAM